MDGRAGVVVVVAGVVVVVGDWMRGGEGVGEEGGAAGRGGAQAVQELEMWWVRHVAC